MDIDVLYVSQSRLYWAIPDLFAIDFTPGTNTGHYSLAREWSESKLGFQHSQLIYLDFIVDI